MKDIVIKQTEREEPVFQVTLTDKRGVKTRHTVTLTETYFDNLTHGKISQIKLIELSFAFLLEKEPSSSILTEFDLEDILRYYPEFDRYIHARVARPE